MRSITSALAATLASSLLLAQRAFADVSLSPAATSSGAGTLSVTIGPSWAGFGIEPSDLVVYTGGANRNQLTYNLLSNLANYTGAPPHIRLGGNAGDTMLYDSSVQGYQLQQNPNPTGTGYSRASDYYSFGNDYLDAMNYFPDDTPITYQLNLAYQGSDWVDRIVAQAQAAFDQVGTTSKGAKIVGLEIGNEPDLYIDLGYRASNWSVYDFGGQWSQAAQAIYNQVLKQKNYGSDFFETACTATTASKHGQGFRISNLVNTGVASDNGIYVAGWNQHDYYYYVNVSQYTLTLSHLLDLSTTVSQFTEWTGQIQQAIVTGKPYYLREMGSVGPNGIQGISETFGNALWTFNFFFFAAVQQISSVQMHMTQYSIAAPWQTNNWNNMGPHVRPTYYAWAAFAQIIGASCNSKIAQVQLSNTPGSYNNRLASYAVYRGTALTSIVMLNTQLTYASGSAGSQNFDISVPNWAGKTVYLAVLTADGVDSTSDVTWNGISYEQSGTGQPSTVNGTIWSMTVGQDGSLSVPVRDSQVVVVSTFALGHEQVNQANCNNLAATATEGGSNTNGGKAAPTFKATSGFKTDSPLSMTAIIAIAAGGGVFLIALLGLFIFCCVRSCKRSKARKARAAAILKAPPRNDNHPLLERDYGDESSHSSYPAYQHSPALKGWESPMTSISHAQQVQPSNSYHNIQPEYEYAPAPYQYHHQYQHSPQQPQTMHSPNPQQTQQYYQQHPGYLQNPYQNYGQSQYSQHGAHGNSGRAY